MKIPVPLLPLYGVFYKVLLWLHELPFTIKFGIYKWWYGGGEKIPQEKVSKLFGPIDQIGMLSMYATVVVSEVARKLGIDYNETVLFTHLCRMHQHVYETTEDVDFINWWHELIQKKPIRRNILQAFFKYSDANLTMVEKLYPGEQRAEFEEWLDAE